MTKINVDKLSNKEKHLLVLSQIVDQNLKRGGPRMKYRRKKHRKTTATFNTTTVDNEEKIEPKESLQAQTTFD